MTNLNDAVLKTAMPVRWRPAGTDSLDMLAKARSETINLVQWLVRIANSFVAASTSEERAEIEFNAGDAAFVTKPFENNLSLKMRLPTLDMQFLESGKPTPHILDPEEHSPAEVEAWLLVELLHRGVDRAKFSKKLPYAIPGLLTGDVQHYLPQSCQQGLTQLMVWFQNAAAVLDATARACDRDGGRILCQPRTLNLSYVSDRRTEMAEFGFSPGDAQNAEPFFYGTAVLNGSPRSEKRSILPAFKLFEEHAPAAAAMILKQAVAE